MTDSDSVLIREVKINDPTSRYHQEILDVLILNGEIYKIDKAIKSDTTVIQGHSLTISPGWLDIGVYSGVPGFEHREDLVSLSKAALNGGFTSVAIWPNTNPAIDTLGIYQSLRNSKMANIRLLPICQAHIGNDIGQMSEMLELVEAGCRVFGIGTSSCDDSPSLFRISDYLSQVKARYIHMPSFPKLVLDSQVFDSEIAMTLGIKAMPRFEENLRVVRDIEAIKLHRM